ncbi:copper chaperone PCu(A)C [Streptomyces sp. TP-A0874]|uniref:copper chaperone PCu(A)C n=1 Tax=Streptomyces sp. TP-A0874 TaxID=549819 RepID=UPI000853DCAB|nr:copper chaperone PCu(A)C [Streptomyces sp. TP-A0874]
MKRRAATALAAVAALGLAGCSTGSDRPELAASGAYIPQPVTAEMAGGYVVIENTGDGADKLTRVTSDISDEVQLHTTEGNSMRQVDSLPVPAHGKLELKRGGDHLMFVNLKHKPTEGEKVTVEFHFAESDPISLEVPVEATNHNPPN